MRCLRCLAVVIINLFFAVGHRLLIILLIFFPKFLDSYFLLRDRIVCAVDPQQICWYTGYLRRWYKIYSRWRLPPTLPANPVQYIEDFVQDVGVCFEVFVRCSDLVGKYAHAHKWEGAEGLLRKAYELAVLWFRTPVAQRCRSPYDFFIPTLVTSMLVDLWFIQWVKNQGMVLQIDPAYSRYIWKLGLAQSLGVDLDSLWRAWYPQAKQHFRELILL